MYNRSANLKPQSQIDSCQTCVYRAYLPSRNLKSCLRSAPGRDRLAAHVRHPDGREACVPVRGPRATERGRGTHGCRAPPRAPGRHQRGHSRAGAALPH